MVLNYYWCCWCCWVVVNWIVIDQRTELLYVRAIENYVYVFFDLLCVGCVRLRDILWRVLLRGDSQAQTIAQARVPRTMVR